MRQVMKEESTKTPGRLTIEEFVCGRELANEHDAHALAVYGDGDEVLGHSKWTTLIAS